MANKEQLGILKQGVEVWNQWRKDNPNAEIDLTGADLIIANLSGVDLIIANLSGANLTEADLREADLRGADLSGANLEGTILRRADLTRANLAGANLSEADLEGANVTGIHLFHTIFFMTILNSVIGLETCEHKEQSNLDKGTIIKSGELPIEFMRGCGMTDSEIELTKAYDKSLTQFEIGEIYHKATMLRQDQPLQFNSVFLSHSNPNKDFVRKLHDKLQDKGVRCWFDEHDMHGGKKIHEQVYKAIQLNDKLVVVLSKESMASNWVKTEIKRARKVEREEKRSVLFPIRICSYEDIQKWELFDESEGADLASEIREYFIPDFSEWENKDSFDKSLNRLMSDLQKRETVGIPS
jgi:hypothetical protein